MSEQTIPCPTCVGVGTVFNGHAEEECPECKGEGKIEVWLDEDSLFEDTSVQSLDLLLNNSNFEPFDENKHTET